MNTEQQRVVKAALQQAANQSMAHLSDLRLTVTLAQEAIAILNECEAQPVSADARKLAQEIVDENYPPQRQHEEISLYNLKVEGAVERASILIERFAQSREVAALANSEDTLPKLPKGWAIHGLQQSWYFADQVFIWRTVLYHPFNQAAKSVPGEGPTPRAAVLAAIALIPPTKQE